MWQCQQQTQSIYKIAYEAILTGEVVRVVVVGVVVFDTREHTVVYTGNTQGRRKNTREVRMYGQMSKTQVRWYRPTYTSVEGA